MERLLVKFVFGFAIALTLVAGAAAVTISRSYPGPVTLSQADRSEAIRIGDSEVLFHFTRNPHDLELYIMVVNNQDLDDVLQTRVRMTDGQVYTLIFHHGAEDEQGAGERITFTRNGDSVVLDSELTKPIERFTRALWPDG